MIVSKINILLISLIFGSLVLQDKQCFGESGEYAPEILKIGYSVKFLSNVGLADAQAALELWVKELSRTSKLKMQPKPVIYEDLQAMANAIKNRKIDFIAITSVDYLKIKDKVPLEAAFVGSSKKAGVGDEVVLLVRRDQRITDIRQLEGKRLVVHTDTLLDSARLWLHAAIASEKWSHRKSFFHSEKEVKKVSQAVLSIFFRQADAALVSRGGFDAMVELNPQIGKELTVLRKSDKLLDGIFCFQKNLRSDLKTEMSSVALNMPTTQTGRQILTLFRISSIQPFVPQMLYSTVALVNAHSNIHIKLADN